MKEYKVIVYKDGTIRWYDPKTNKLHREDGPAIIASKGYEASCINGLLHGKEKLIDGNINWYFEGNLCTEEEFKKPTTSLDNKTAWIEGKQYRLELIKE